MFTSILSRSKNRNSPPAWRVQASRRAPFPGKKGLVSFFPAPLQKKKPPAGMEGPSEPPRPEYLPYPAPICEASWQSFSARNGQVIDFQEEQHIIDEVHTEEDR